MPVKFSARLSETWLKAAVVGSLWASFEIIIGSFLHNLRFPFAGTILSFASVALVIAFLQIWDNKGLIWKAGLIAALLKSMSPSAIILGPMIGIFSEALILEFMIMLLGRNMLAYLLGGAMAVLSALMHKLVSLLVTYGFDLVIIVDQLYKYIIRQMGMTKGDPALLLSVVMLAYVLLGMAGAIIGYLAGKKANTIREGVEREIIPDRQSSFFNETKDQKASAWFLLYHLFCIISCLFMLNSVSLEISFIPAVLYAAFCLYWYRGSMRSFRKPSFWIWFMSITLLAAVFWNGLSKGELWDTEGLLIGLKMNLRAIVILTGFAALSRELRNPLIRTVLYHHGFASVYHAVGLAFSVLPGIIDSLPGMKKLISRPVSSLGMIVRNAADVYPALEKELAGQSPVIIITGNVQEGKTSFLIELVDLLKKNKVRVDGFMARGIHDEHGRIGYDLEHIFDGERQVYIRNKPSVGWYQYGKYYFNPEGEEFGKRILECINTENNDLLVIDEIGPVELKGRGWAGEIETLLNSSRVVQLWVVRKSLLKKVIRQWNVGDIMVLDISTDTLEASIGEVILFIKNSGK
jgi:nucleoside-triphosphatase THEP1